MLVAAIEILQKYRRVTSRFENLKRRYIPSMRCGSALKFDMEGDGGQSPELAITYAGHMPYCGPDFGLAHMHVIRDKVNKNEEDDDTKSSHSGKSTPRRRGKGQKREAPGNDPNKDPKHQTQVLGYSKSALPSIKGFSSAPVICQ